MKCKIKWVSEENNWLPTPDDNDAIGMAQCNWVDHRGFSTSEELPICAQHAKYKVPVCHTYDMDGTTFMSWWTFRLLTDEEKSK